MTYPIVSIADSHTVIIPDFIVANRQEEAKCPAVGGMNRHVSALMMEHRRNFLRFLRSRLKDSDEAEDVLQEFCVKVILKSDQIKDQASAIGWLRIVLKSVLADHFRRKTAEREALFLYAQEYQALSENIDIFADVEGDANVETDKVSCGCLSRLLPGLKAKYVDVITRVDIEQGDRKQVAKDIGITEKNLRVRLHRGRRALKMALKKSCAHCDEGGCRTAEAAGIR